MLTAHIVCTYPLLTCLYRLCLPSLPAVTAHMPCSQLLACPHRSYIFKLHPILCCRLVEGMNLDDLCYKVRKAASRMQPLQLNQLRRWMWSFTMRVVLCIAKVRLITLSNLFVSLLFTSHIMGCHMAGQSHSDLDPHMILCHCCKLQITGCKMAGQSHLKSYPDTKLSWRRSMVAFWCAACVRLTFYSMSDARECKSYCQPY